VSAVSVAPVDDAALVEYAQVVDAFSVHDAPIVASHRAQGTDTTVTTDAIDDAGYETVWE